MRRALLLIDNPWITHNCQALEQIAIAFTLFLNFRPSP